MYHSAARPDRNRPNDGVLGGYNLTCDQYITRWDRIWDLLSRDRVAAGAAAALAQSFTPRGGTPVDEAFLRDMEEWRQDLANDLLRRQSDLEFWQLEEATQRILDRLVFVRVVEDRDIEQGVVLRKYARLTDSYRFLRGEFRRLDAFYNGQLFAEHFSERLEVSDHVIQTIIANLYAVDGSPYRFDTFQADFLGKVYERFLGKQFVPAGTTRVRLVDKPEVRHAGGVYYTPRWVVDHMVATAMGPLVSGKTPRQVARLRIVDPACGSGTFLLGVLDFLILWHERYYDANSKADTDNHFVGENGRRQLTTDFKGRILVNNVYGVDVDPRAVEVAQMSLYLRILEQETAASIGAQTRLFQGAHLPSLARNIRAGNSLISETDVPVALLADLDLRRRINPFDWRAGTNGFGSVFTDENGFDVVIGNPPYTRVQEMRRSRPEETAIIEQHYGSAVAGFDIASLFTERALTLIKPRAGRNPGGRVTFITSRTFTETNAGTGIRGVLANGSHVHSIIDFGPGLVFAEAGAYTVILIATARSNSTWDLTRVPAPPSRDALLAAIQDPILHADLPATALPGNDSWPLALPAEDAILKRLSAAHPTLGRITGNVIFQGIVTGSDGVFRAVDLGPDPANPARRRVRPASAPDDSEPLFFESALLRPIYAGRSDFRPFWTARSREWVIMPYAPPHPGEAFMLLPWTRLAREAPEIAAWLQANENTLRERSGQWTDDNWYSYSRRQNLERFSRAKIMVPSMIDTSAQPSMPTDTSSSTSPPAATASTTTPPVEPPRSTSLHSSTALCCRGSCRSTPAPGGVAGSRRARATCNVSRSPSRRKLARTISSLYTTACVTPSLPQLRRRTMFSSGASRTRHDAHSITRCTRFTV